MIELNCACTVHSATTKLEGAVGNLIPGSVKASMHEKMAKPLGDK